MSLLEQKELSSLISIADVNVSEARELVRSLMFNGVPPGMERLDTSEKVTMYDAYLKRNANRETAGTVPGTVHTDLAANPDIQRMNALPAQMAAASSAGVVQ